MTTATAVDYSVNYAGFDMFKIACQEAGRPTAENLRRNGFQEETWSRGESAFVMRTPWKGKYLAHVEEGLGTKNIPADRMAEAIVFAVASRKVFSEMQKVFLGESSLRAGKEAGKSFFKEVAQCNVAMAINDLITVGASPLSYLLHLAVGDADWFKNEQRWNDLIEGTKKACDIAGCVWGGGETPVLRNIVVPGAALLSGSATGFISSEKRLINPANIKDGDAIILFESSGPHANGYTMLWDVVAPRLPDGYLTKIPDDGRTFGEAILAPTVIYFQLIQECMDRGVRIHYAVNITGHGWCKLMRAPKAFVYIINKLPRQQPLFDFIQQWNPIDSKKMYRTFNMGAGFAIYVPQKDVSKVLDVAEVFYGATVAGHIEKSSVKEVIIEPMGIKFGPEDLAIR